MHPLTCERSSAMSVFSRSTAFAVALGLAVAGVGLFPFHAAAEDNVEKLLRECSAGSADSPLFEWFHCIGYITGIGDMMGLNGLLIAKYDEGVINLNHLAFCPGKPAPTYGATLQVFKNWAQRHPERWGDKAFVGVIAALREAWPCP